jgi:hypothetical protein
MGAIMSSAETGISKKMRGVAAFFILMAAAFFPCLQASAQAPAQVVFNYETHYGLKQIVADGVPLLTGCGLGFIGSQSGVDDNNNITTCKPNNGGVMRPFNGAQSPFLHHQLFFMPAPGVPNRLLFGGEVGVSNFDFAALSMPMDARRDEFKYFRYPGSGLMRYSQNPYAYTDPFGGSAYIASAGIGHAWGEIISDRFTIRVVLTGTTMEMPLYFVDFARIGVRNVEFSFNSIGVGEKHHVTGYVEVFRTDPASLPSWTFETEGHAYHQIGRADGDGWSVNVVDDAPGRYMNYGPYTPEIESGSRTATFRLMLDNVTADNLRILTLDVYDATTQTVLASRQIRRSEFRQPFVYQDFALPFAAAQNHLLEFRTYWHGSSYAKQDKVIVR